MIWLENEPPVIDLGAAGSVTLDQGWLEQCLEEAASAAGYEEWPAGDVARSVTEFFLRSVLRPPIRSRRSPQKCTGFCGGSATRKWLPFF